MSNVIDISGGSLRASGDSDQIEHLKRGGGGGNSGGMEPASKEYVDLKLAAAMTEVRGEFALINQRLGSLEARMPSWWSVLGAVMIGVGLVLAALAFAGDRFDGGIGLADQRLEQLKRDQEQSEQLGKILIKLDRLTDERSQSDHQPD